MVTIRLEKMHFKVLEFALESCPLIKSPSFLLLIDDHDSNR